MSKLEEALEKANKLRGSVSDDSNRSGDTLHKTESFINIGAAKVELKEVNNADIVTITELT